MVFQTGHIYTVGHQANYRRMARVFERDGQQVTKAGIDTSHIIAPLYGGIAFRDPWEAAEYLHQNEVLGIWAVWVIMADWDEGTWQLAGENFRRIIFDAWVVCEWEPGLGYCKNGSPFPMGQW